MTENEAKNVLDNVWDFAILADDESGDILEKAIDIANKALEEIQQYRAIGTVEGYELAINESIDKHNLMIVYKDRLKEFEAIGTIEEFKALKDKLQGYKNQMSIYAEQHKVILASDVLDMLEEIDWQ